MGRVPQNTNGIGLTARATTLANFPLLAMFAIQDILDVGATKGYLPGGWRKEPIQYHLDKAKGHMDRVGQRGAQENHLEHALTRLAMAVDLLRRAGSGRDTEG